MMPSVQFGIQQQGKTREKKQDIQHQQDRFTGTAVLSS